MSLHRCGSAAARGHRDPDEGRALYGRPCSPWAAARILLEFLNSWFVDRPSAVRPVKRLARLLAIVWLMAALSLVGWLIVNLDTAGWILLVLTTGLMIFELSRAPARSDGPPRRTKSTGLPNEPGG